MRLCRRSSVSVCYLMSSLPLTRSSSIRDYRRRHFLKGICSEIVPGTMWLIIKILITRSQLCLQDTIILFRLSTHDNICVFFSDLLFADIYYLVYSLLYFFLDSRLYCLRVSGECSFYHIQRCILLNLGTIVL